MGSKDKKNEVVEDSDEEVEVENSDDEVFLLLCSWKWKRKSKKESKLYLHFRKKFRLLPLMDIWLKKEGWIKSCKQNKMHVRGNLESNTYPTSMRWMTSFRENINLLTLIFKK